MSENRIAEPADSSEEITITESNVAVANAEIAAAHIAGLLENAKAAVTATEQAKRQAETVLADAQRQASALLADAQSKVAELKEATTLALASKTQITDEQAVIAKKSSHIHDAQVHADNVRTELDRALTAAKQQATEAEGLKARTQSVVDQATAVLAEIRAANVAATADAEAITLAKTEAEEAAETSKALALKSTTVERDITKYENELRRLIDESDKQLKTITGLLPGATSAGLASAFDDRRETFLRPHGRWQWVFIVAVLAIVVLTGWGLWLTYSMAAAPTWDELARIWVARLPIVGALVWLAMYASREAALAKRLEEDYGYKAAIAACFEGFKKQLSELAAGQPADSPLIRLYENTLSIIASPPGRIYDKHKLTVSPADDLRQLVKTVIAEKAKKDDTAG